MRLHARLARLLRPPRLMRFSFRRLLCLAILSFGSSLGCDPSESEPEVSVLPPASVEGAPAGDGTGVMLAVDRFRLGTLDLDDLPSSDAWMLYGYDLDGVVSRSSFEGHCKPAAGASPEYTFEDGDGGVDNSFGKLVVPMLETFTDPSDSLTVESGVNGTLGGNSDGLLLHLRDLGGQANYGSISAFAYGLRGPWLLAPESVSDPMASDFGQVLDSGLIELSESFVTDNVWVGRGPAAVVELSWRVGGEQLILRVHNPTITAELSPGHAEVRRGILAGVLDVEETQAALGAWMARFSESLCDGSARDGLVGQLPNMADIMNDGTQTDSAICNGISFGIGFEAFEAHVDELGEARDLVDPCAIE